MQVHYIKYNLSYISALLTLGIVDLIYGIFVSPFFIENYVNTDWEQGLGYCRFFIYIFTFHDLFIPLVLILLSSYVSLTFAGRQY